MYHAEEIFYYIPKIEKNLVLACWKKAKELSLAILCAALLRQLLMF
jgi:hypothetical protein